MINYEQTWQMFPDHPGLQVQNAIGTTDLICTHTPFPEHVVAEQVTPINATIIKI